MIKLVFTSDLHINGPCYSDILFNSFMNTIRERNIDALVLGGDIADGRGALSTALKCIKSKYLPDVPVLVVPGNHDLWSSSWKHGLTSDSIFYEEFPKVCIDSGCVCLETDNFKLGSWLIAGSVMWYDYSSKLVGPSEIRLLPDKFYEHNKYLYTVDGRRMKLSKSDVEFSDELLCSICSRIDVGLEDPTIKNLAVVTHVPMFEEATVWKDHSWNLGSQYFYNLTAGSRLLQYDSLKLVMSGHTHFGVENEDRGFPCLVCYADYGELDGFELELSEDGVVAYSRLCPIVE